MYHSAELLQRRTSSDTERALEHINEALVISMYSEKLLEMKAEALLMVGASFLYYATITLKIILCLLMYMSDRICSTEATIQLELVMPAQYLLCHCLSLFGAVTKLPCSCTLYKWWSQHSETPYGISQLQFLYFSQIL
jgi:hypothetical protein